MKDQYKSIIRGYGKIFEPLNSGLRNIGFKMFSDKTGMNVLDIWLWYGDTSQITSKRKL